MATTNRKYADVWLPIPTEPACYTYLWAPHLPPQPLGLLVTVPLGKTVLIGVVIAVHNSPPTPHIRYRSVREVVTPEPLPQRVLSFWQWVADYYMCPVGEVIRQALPNLIATQEAATKSPKMGWIPSPKVYTNTAFYHQLQGSLRGPKALATLERIRETFRRKANNLEQAFVAAPLSYWQEEWGVGASVLQKLRQVGVLVSAPLAVKPPSPHNQEEYPDIATPLLSSLKGVTLLHTPYYTLAATIPYNLLLQYAQQGGQVLLLLPTADWAPELTPHFQKYWGKHFKNAFANTHKTAAWLAALRGEPGIYCSSKAGVWLPFTALTLVVVMDEESAAYQQYIPTPRYHAVRTALLLAQLHHAPALLVSSAPTVDTMLRVAKGDYGYVPLNPSGVAEPLVETVVLASAFKKNKVRARLLSFEMIEAINSALVQGQQVLLYYHRSGYANQLTCEHCAHTDTCPQCQVPYRYFAQRNNLVCPLCGHVAPVPHQCPQCGSTNILPEGTGIERLLEQVQQYFPTAKTVYENGATATADIILSNSYTPTRTLLRNAAVVGVVRADLIANMPDYRGNERLFAFLMQCRQLAPKLQCFVIQSLKPNVNAIEAFVQGSYRHLFDYEVKSRHMVKYPPFARMVDVYLEGAEAKSLFHTAQLLATALRQQLSLIAVLGPAPLPVRMRKVAAGYKVSVLHHLKQPYKQMHADIRKVTQQVVEQSSQTVVVSYNVDP